MKTPLPVSMTVLVLALAASLVACKTDLDGAKNNYRSQYKTYDVDIATATEAAKDVLNDLELREVEATHTTIDGQATAKTADDTEVTVNVTRVTEGRSEVAVYVGNLGNPKLGNRILAHIDAKLLGTDVSELLDDAEDAVEDATDAASDAAE